MASFPSLTLYRADGACSRVPHILLRHLSIPSDSVLLADPAPRFAAADGSFSANEYRKIHPSGYVPALVFDGGGFFTEIPALLAQGKIIGEESVIEGIENAPQAIVDMLTGGRGADVGKPVIIVAKA